MGDIIELTGASSAAPGPRGTEEAVRERLLGAFTADQIVRHYKSLLKARKALSATEAKKADGAAAAQTTRCGWRR